MVRIAQGEFDRFNGCFLDATGLDELKAGEASLGASDDLRIEFVRDTRGRKTLVRCSRHYR